MGGILSQKIYYSESQDNKYYLLQKIGLPNMNRLLFVSLFSLPFSIS